MRKIKYITGVVVLSIMLMGAGYASWRQNMNISNLISTGQVKFEVDITEEIENGQGGGDRDIQVSKNPNTVGIIIDNAYPGLKQTNTLKIRNESSIPTKLDVEFEKFRYTNSYDEVVGIEEEVIFKDENGEIIQAENISQRQMKPREGLTVIIKTEVTDQAVQSIGGFQTIKINMVQSTDLQGNEKITRMDDTGRYQE